MTSSSHSERFLSLLLSFTALLIYPAGTALAPAAQQAPATRPAAPALPNPSKPHPRPTTRRTLADAPTTRKSDAHRPTTRPLLAQQPDYIPAFKYVVPYTLGAYRADIGDALYVTQVLGTAPIFRPGNLYKFYITYNLASHPAAIIGVHG